MAKKKKKKTQCEPQFGSDLVRISLKLSLVFLRANGWRRRGYTEFLCSHSQRHWNSPFFLFSLDRQTTFWSRYTKRPIWHSGMGMLSRVRLSAKTLFLMCSDTSGRRSHCCFASQLSNVQPDFHFRSDENSLQDRRFDRRQVGALGDRACEGIEPVVVVEEEEQEEEERILQLTSMQQFGHIGRRQTSKDLELLEVADMDLMVLAKGDGVCSPKRSEGRHWFMVRLQACSIVSSYRDKQRDFVRAMAMVLSLIMMYCI